MGSMIGGLWLLRNERVAFRSNTVAILHGEQSLLRGLVDSGRKVLAALLFIIPGVLSDALALLLLLLPINHGRYRPMPATVRGDYRRANAIDGVFRRMD